MTGDGLCTVLKKKIYKDTYFIIDASVGFKK